MRVILYSVCVMALSVTGCNDLDSDGDSGGAGGASGGGLVTLNGAVNKGPFVTGSTVNVSPVGATGNPTGAVYSTQTLNDLGEFSVDFDYAGLVSLEGSGFYYNEAVGELSGANITLRAFYEVAAAGTQAAHINIITHLSYNRVKTLMTEGSAFTAAVAQAEGELRAALAISPEGFDPGAQGTQMNISGGDNAANAYLLATSAVFAKAAMRRQRDGGSIDANLQEILNTFGSDLQADGALNEDKVAELAAAKLALDTAAVKTKLAARLNDVGSAAGVPDLDTVIDQDGDGQTNVNDCLPLDPTRWTGNADLDGDGHESIYCGGDDCVDFVEGFHGETCLQTLNLVATASDSAAGQGCAIQPSGEVLCSMGGPPNPTTDAAELWRSPEGSRFISVSPIGGDQWTCGILEDLSIQCWTMEGDVVDGFWDGIDGIPDGLFHQMQLSDGMLCGIDGEGALRCWGQPGCDWQRAPDLSVQPFRPLPDGVYSDFDLGHCLTCGIDADQAIQCWPDAGAIQPNDRVNPPDGRFTSLSLSRSGFHLCAVGSDRSVGCWVPQGPTPTPEGEFTAVSAGGEWGPMTFACGLRVDGSVTCWENTNGQVDVPPGPFLQVSVSERSACGLRPNARVECWTLQVGQIPPNPPPVDPDRMDGGVSPDGDGGASQDGDGGRGCGGCAPDERCIDDRCVPLDEPTCEDIFVCAQGCNGDQGCMNDCVESASETARRAFDAFNACVMGCMNEECVLARCSREFQDCFDQDDVPPPGGPQCVDDPEVDLQRVCRYYARCLNANCAFSGDRCLRVTEETCIEQGRQLGGVAVTGLVCQLDTCDVLLERLLPLGNASARAACMPDAPVEFCQEMGPPVPNDGDAGVPDPDDGDGGAPDPDDGDAGVPRPGPQDRDGAVPDPPDRDGGAGPGPNCPDDDVEQRLRAVCNYVADCLIESCAYEGDICRAELTGACIMSGGGNPVAFTDIGCAQRDCTELINTFRASDPMLDQMCEEGAPPTQCNE